MRSDCDRRWEIDALREGKLGDRDAEAFERHARACEACAATIARDVQLRKLGQELPPCEPNELDLRRLRARVLHDIATGVPSRWTASTALAAAAILVCLAAVSWAVIIRATSRAPASLASKASTAPSQVAMPASPPAPAFAGTVLRADRARWSQSREGDVERVRLDEGALTIHVRHQTGTERFLVVLPDGELEVHGTTFDVSVSAGSTERVDVEEGTVVLRINGLAAERELNGGESWRAPKPTGPAKQPTRALQRAVTGAANAAPPAPAMPASAHISVVTTTEDEIDAYTAAMALFQSRQFGPAARAFHAFVLSYPQASQAEDASFLEAASLARAGRTDAAGLAAEDHLARFPKSFHHREAAILIARAARDRGDCTQARAVLAPWLGVTPDDEARATLRSCADDDTKPR